jgi:hypothetical protein
MKSKITVLSLLFTSILAAGAVTSPAAAENMRQSATGSGQFEFTSDTGVTALRTFAFEAGKSSDGTVSGEAQIKNRATGATLHIRIDCLNVIGNVAVMSGTATFATGGGNSVGDAEIFGVEDNGQGAGSSPDLVTRPFRNSGLVCTDITAEMLPGLAGLFNVVEEGNIQVQ